MTDLVIDVYGTLIFMAAMAAAFCIVVWFTCRVISYRIEGWIARADLEWKRRHRIP